MPHLRKFIRKIALLSIPIWIHLGIYLLADPFMVVGNYHDFYAERTIPVALDKDYVSTMTYTHRRENASYDAFIFGNSRSMYYEIDDWKQQIGKGYHAFHFDASDESLYGILKKMEYIDHMKDTLRQVLFVIDSRLLEQTVPQNSSHLYYISPVLEHYTNWIGFHLTHWQAFLNLKFTYAVCDYYCNREIKDYMVSNHYLENFNVTYDAETNEVREEDFEREIASGTYYTPQRMRAFEEKQQQGVSAPVIEREQLALLHKIRAILKKHQTHYKMVISPLYDQIQINPEDYRKLVHIFGENRIYDYSGVNKMTRDCHNYYEASHYRPTVARKIMKEIYARK